MIPTYLFLSLLGVLALLSTILATSKKPKKPLEFLPAPGSLKALYSSARLKMDKWEPPRLTKKQQKDAVMERDGGLNAVFHLHLLELPLNPTKNSLKDQTFIKSMCSDPALISLSVKLAATKFSVEMIPTKFNRVKGTVERFCQAARQFLPMSDPHSPTDTYSRTLKGLRQSFGHTRKGALRLESPFMPETTVTADNLQLLCSVPANLAKLLPRFYGVISISLLILLRLRPDKSRAPFDPVRDALLETKRDSHRVQLQCLRVALDTAGEVYKLSEDKAEGMGQSVTAFNMAKRSIDLILSSAYLEKTRWLAYLQDARIAVVKHQRPSRTDFIMKEMPEGVEKTDLDIYRAFLMVSEKVGEYLSEPFKDRFSDRDGLPTTGMIKWSFQQPLAEKILLPEATKAIEILEQREE